MPPAAGGDSQRRRPEKVKAAPARWTARNPSLLTRGLDWSLQANPSVQIVERTSLAWFLFPMVYRSSLQRETAIGLPPTDRNYRYLFQVTVKFALFQVPLVKPEVTWTTRPEPKVPSFWLIL